MRVTNQNKVQSMAVIQIYFKICTINICLEKKMLLPILK